MKKAPLTIALLAVTLLTVSASVAESPEAPADLVVQGLEPAEKADLAMCDIVGTVNRMKLVKRSPWSDGTPTAAMATLETHISVIIDDRSPHNKQAAQNDPCHKEAKGEQRTYKLCSPTPVKQGDRIHGTEGTQTGSVYAVGCLFDLVVLPTQ